MRSRYVIKEALTPTTYSTTRADDGREEVWPLLDGHGTVDGGMVVLGKKVVGSVEYVDLGEGEVRLAPRIWGSSSLMSGSYCHVLASIFQMRTFGGLSCESDGMMEMFILM